MCYYLIKNKSSKIQFIFYNRDFNDILYISTLEEILNVGGYREKEIPSPISNLAVKILIADNTAAFSCGNVGRRQLVRSLFLFMVKIIMIVKFAWLVCFYLFSALILFVNILIWILFID